MWLSSGGVEGTCCYYEGGEQEGSVGFDYLRVEVLHGSACEWRVKVRAFGLVGAQPHADAIPSFPSVLLADMI